MVDFHVHCDFSIDAEGAIEAYARAALGKGLTHICFTTHCDLDPARRHHDGRVRYKGKIVDVTSGWLESYKDEVREAQDTYAGQGLSIMCGLEVGYVPGIEHMIESVLDSEGLDFVIGGVHTLEGIDIVSSRECNDYFSTRAPVQMCELYFHDVLEAVRCDLFDAIAHIDIYKRCGLDFYGEPLNQAHEGFIEPVLGEIAERGISLEINSGGLRKGLRWPYPSADLMALAREAGVRGITIGSDCHRPEDIGYGLGACLDHALQYGYGAVDVYRGRARSSIPIRKPDDENP